MPGSGKSSVGKILAEKLDREFIDTDGLIEQKEGTDIPTIINNKGEKYFRALEKEILKEIAPLTGKVISTGGGVVVDKENHFYLSANGKIFLLNRDLEKLATNGRPLSSDLDALKKRYEERRDKYLDFADFEIDNNGEMENAVKGVLERL
jgi:shikimate dehydrogenase